MVLIVPSLYGHLEQGGVLFMLFSFLFSGIEIEPSMMGSSIMLVLIRLLLLLIRQVTLLPLLQSEQLLSALKLP